MSVWGFAILTVGAVALAGPFPHVVVGILVLILSGMILSKAFYPNEVNLITNIFGTSSSTTTGATTNG